MRKVGARQGCSEAQGAAEAQTKRVEDGKNRSAPLGCCGWETGRLKTGI